MTTLAPKPPEHSPASSSGKKPPSKAGTIGLALVMILCILLGIGVLGYPVVATQLNNWEQSKVAKAFNAQAEGASPEEAAAALEEARFYNESHRSIAFEDPWTGTSPAGELDYQVYLDVLDQFPAMGQLAIPALSINLPIYHGTDDTTLLKGVGHLYGTPLPIGGEGNRSALTAHSGIPDATFFDNLEKITKGDAIYVRNIGETLKYEVRDIQVILPTELEKIQPEEGKDLITLITCTPYGINTHRLLVTAERVPMDPAEDVDAFGGDGIVWQWWMKLAIAVVAFILLLALALVVWLIRSKLKKSTKDVA